MYPLFPSLLPYPTETLEVALVGALWLLAYRWEWLRERLRQVPRADVQWLLAWSIVGFGLRLLGGVRVPGHINSHGYEYLNTVFSGPIDGLEFHGNGSYALHQLGLAVLPATESGVLAIQLLCSVLTIPAMYAVSRLWVGVREGALAAAAMAAVLPSFVFYALTEERLVGGTFFLLVALVAVGIAVREKGLATWAAAAALGAFAVSFQPFLLFFPFAAGGLLLAQPDGRRALRSGACWSALAVFAVLSVDTAFLALSHISEHREPSGMAFGFLHAPWRAFLPLANLHNDFPGNTFAHADFTPPPFLWLEILGVAAAARHRVRLPVLVMAAMVAVLTLVATVPARMNTARLQLPAHVFNVLLAGHGLGYVIERLRSILRGGSRLATAVAALVPIASAAVWPGPIGASFTPQLERHVAGDGLGAIPSGCEILIPAISGVAGLDYLSPGIVWRAVLPGQALPKGIACFVYFRPARCYDVNDAVPGAERADGLRADCAAVERTLDPTPLFARLVAARPDYLQHYLRDALLIGYFRVH